jgi:hypothetical protein
LREQIHKAAAGRSAVVADLYDLPTHVIRDLWARKVLRARMRVWLCFGQAGSLLLKLLDTGEPRTVCQPAGAHLPENEIPKTRGFPVV